MFAIGVFYSGVKVIRICNDSRTVHLYVIKKLYHRISNKGIVYVSTVKFIYVNGSKTV